MRNIYLWYELFAHCIRTLFHMKISRYHCSLNHAQKAMNYDRWMCCVRLRTESINRFVCANMHQTLILSTLLQTTTYCHCLMYEIHIFIDKWSGSKTNRRRPISLSLFYYFTYDNIYDRLNNGLEKTEILIQNHFIAFHWGRSFCESIHRWT